MAGHGPPPKDPARRARRNAGPAPLRVVEDVEPHAQPGLPAFNVWVLNAEGQMVQKRFVWPAQTKKWWQMWADSPLSDDFTATDWSELLDTARLHADYWRGNLKVASELRLRVANFGATPADRARLRIQFAMAKNAERTPPAPQGPSVVGETGSATGDAQPRGPRRLTG